MTKKYTKTTLQLSYFYFQKKKILLLLSTVILSFTVTTATTTKPGEFSRILAPGTLGLKREKFIPLHFYFHDIVSGKNPTAVTIAQAYTTKSHQPGSDCSAQGSIGRKELKSHCLMPVLMKTENCQQPILSSCKNEGLGRLEVRLAVAAVWSKDKAKGINQVDVGLSPRKEERLRCCCQTRQNGKLVLGILETKQQF